MTRIVIDKNVSDEATTLVSDEATKLLLKKRTHILKEIILIFKEVKSVNEDIILIFLEIYLFSKVMMYTSIVDSNIIVRVSV